MESSNPISISRLTVPVASVCAVILLIIGASQAYASIAARVSSQGTEIEEIKAAIKEMPSGREYTKFEQNVNSRFDAFEKKLDSLLKK